MRSFVKQGQMVAKFHDNTITTILLRKIAIIIADICLKSLI
jgi:hypothetical protein